MELKISTRLLGQFRNAFYGHHLRTAQSKFFKIGGWILKMMNHLTPASIKRFQNYVQQSFTHLKCFSLKIESSDGPKVRGRALIDISNLFHHSLGNRCIYSFIYIPDVSQRWCRPSSFIMSNAKNAFGTFVYEENMN